LPAMILKTAIAIVLFTRIHSSSRRTRLFFLVMAFPPVPFIHFTITGSRLYIDDTAWQAARCPGRTSLNGLCSINFIATGSGNIKSYGELFEFLGQII
jgi:hypothetical protein